MYMHDVRALGYNDITNLRLLRETDDGKLKKKVTISLSCSS